MKKKRERVRILAEVGERVALANEFRTDDFQDTVAKLVNSARENWRDENGDLPARGTDPSFDALMELADMADSSPTAVRDAAARAMRPQEERLKAAS